MDSDRSGGPVVDPTANVIALIEAATARQDDLREETTKRIDAGLIHQQELAKVRDECARDMADIRERHSKEIRTLESDRLDKIRQVDVLAGNTASDRSLIAIQTLATSQAAAAETLRSMVTTTAATIATQTA